MGEHDKDIPVFKVFQHNGTYYLYDTYTNSLFGISREHYVELCILKNVGIQQYLSLHKEERAYRDILLLMEKGMLKENFISMVEHPETYKIPYLLERCVNHMILQVTRDCNFRCRYCLYAGNGKVEREHENVEMSWQMAKSAIDFLYQHSKDADSLCITFYGGEPLLNFGLIVKVVEYTQIRFFTKKVQYTMTINASLLTDKMLEFFILHSFDISISLDGPEKIQNSHRRFKDTGGATYDTVIRNVKKIKRVNEEYFAKHISFLPVSIDDENEQDVLQFFDEIGVEKDKITPLEANLSGIDYTLSEVKLDDFGKKRNGMLHLYDYRISSLEKQLEKKESLSEVWHHDGQCVPGIERVFVDVYGTLFPCEKIIEDKGYSIGNINDGFDIDKIKKFLNIGKLTERECKKCWALRLCEMCISTCLDVDIHDISWEQKEMSCKQQKNLLLNKMKFLAESKKDVLE